MGTTDNLEDVGYLQDIISYIFDEKKIVTYKWISNVLAIHVNRAKQLLYTFLKHISEERLKELKVTYLVGGILPDDRGCRLQVVSEDDLEKVKTQFKVITSEHIYSVSLKNCLTELQDLCLVDGVKDSKVGRHGAVKYSKDTLRTAEELASKRQGAYKALDDDKKWPTAQIKQEKESSGESNNKKSSKAPNGISAMFAAQNGKKKVEDNALSKKPEAQKGESASSPEKKAPAAKNAPKGGKPPANRLAAMFSAQNTKPKAAKKIDQEENKSKSDKEDSEKDTKVPENNSKLDDKHEKKKNDNKNTQEKSSKKKTKSDSKKSKQKKRKASDNEDKSKKRKRIVMMEDSESSGDDIFGSDDDEEEEDKSYSQPPPENEEETEEIEEVTEVAAPKEPDQPEPEANGHRGRKRCLVDKTFMDEEGYMVTKKVYEFVSNDDKSESEEEKENEKKKESKKNKTETQQVSKTVQVSPKTQKNSIQKKNSSPEKKKQATLMNFFKRS